MIHMYMCTYVPCFIDTGRYLFTEYSHVFSRSLRALELANGEHSHQTSLGWVGIRNWILVFHGEKPLILVNYNISLT